MDGHADCHRQEDIIGRTIVMTCSRPSTITHSKLLLIRSCCKLSYAFTLCSFLLFGERRSDHKKGRWDTINRLKLTISFYPSKIQLSFFVFLEFEIYHMSGQFCNGYLYCRPAQLTASNGCISNIKLTFGCNPWF